jgi:hypothetical protein
MLLCHAGLYGQTFFEITPGQSMLMFGKGKGQDATINPFEGEDCLAVIKNMGATAFSVRIQQKGKILKTVLVKPNKTKKIILLVGHELYLDSETQKTAQARVGYERLAPQID